MGRFLFAVALMVSSAAIDSASRKAASYIYSLRTLLQLLGCHRRVNFWLATAQIMLNAASVVKQNRAQTAS